jgi:hypothetical protein
VEKLADRAMGSGFGQGSGGFATGPGRLGWRGCDW